MMEEIDFHNVRSDLEQAVLDFTATGPLLVRYVTVINAIHDTRLDRAGLRVLAAIVQHADRQTGRTWVGRAVLAETANISVKSVSNYIHQLKSFGYVEAERRKTPEVGGKILMHYQIKGMDLAQRSDHENKLDRILSSILTTRSNVTKLPVPTGTQQSTSCQNGKSGVPVVTGSSAASSRSDRKSQVPAPTGSSYPDGKMLCKEAPENGEEAIMTSRQDGKSPSKRALSIKESIRLEEKDRGNASASVPVRTGTPKQKKSSDRGSRLRSDWVLPKAWGEWALENFVVTPEQIRAEAEKFKDHFVAVSGASAVKRDWLAAWRNWIRRSRPGFKKRPSPSDIAPDLISMAGRPSKGWLNGYETNSDENVGFPDGTRGQACDHPAWKPIA